MLLTQTTSLSETVRDSSGKAILSITLSDPKLSPVVIYNVWPQCTHHRVITFYTRELLCEIGLFTCRNVAPHGIVEFRDLGSSFDGTVYQCEPLKGDKRVYCEGGGRSDEILDCVRAFEE